MTFIVALRHDRISAPWVIDGPIDMASSRSSNIASSCYRWRDRCKGSLRHQAVVVAQRQHFGLFNTRW